ncbi:hypothetical protein AB6A23_12855 [Paenibacillus tarimensis]
MNIFERQRMKKSLRGCDYDLAANVIKEKFIDKNNENHGHLSRLIDIFISNPCLEHALKLIEQDSMMFFYFNGCKEDGLYTKQSNKINKVSADDRNMHVPTNNLSVMNPKKTKFPNVISTLTYDYSELENQIKEFQRLLQEGTDVERNRKLLEKYKEGLREFEKAIEVLQNYDEIDLRDKSISSRNY